MYTWGYLVDASLHKLDMDRKLAQQYGYLDKMTYFANEAITQICSAVKPKRTFAIFTVVDKDEVLRNLQIKYPDKNFSFLLYNKYSLNDLDEFERKCWEEYHSLTFLNEISRMPKDFISYGDEENKVTRNTIYDKKERVVATDEMYEVRGSNNIIFFEPGIYEISYNAKWTYFDSNTDYDEIIDAPDDVLECIPSYIVSQIYKIDDETKSIAYRNEFEQFVSRIDDDHYVGNKTIHITGGW